MPEQAIGWLSCAQQNVDLVRDLVRKDSIRMFSEPRGGTNIRHTLTGAVDNGAASRQSCGTGAGPGATNAADSDDPLPVLRLLMPSSKQFEIV